MNILPSHLQSFFSNISTFGLPSLETISINSNCSVIEKNLFDKSSNLSIIPASQQPLKIIKPQHTITKKTQDSSQVNYKYICIKKEFFNVNMVYLNYFNLKKKKYIEIIYKSPSIFLEGLFFKSPKIPLSIIDIIKTTKQYDSVIKENITLKITFKDNFAVDFVKMLVNLDNYIINYITNCSQEIQNELKKNFQETKNIINFKYDNIIKSKGHNGNIVELNLKSFLSSSTIQELEIFKLINQSKEIILTFNISNIFIGNNVIVPLIKCNQHEYV